ncbi:NADPH-dependent FMN reductase [Flavobacterium sedimenticola]|uniref:NAD(P)H-dependent oxidoreductase n=1 Tax=Flavobacterium sedimenticola TaxID=3043286 RepID=A0ABT6XRY5_9FLAO|nr:NAD(P)H-dependent oxidoreductase [Flavobacterium sedimenticola]MDI9257760.1 NAD(P)H-dependent oxidoreductase [Flavobacterium sedimenticola]
MIKILAFGASNSSDSINKQLAHYAALQFPDAVVELLDLNDYEMPIYSKDREKAGGIPPLAHDFYQKIGASDLIVISFAENNGNYTTAFKNILDWMSRINGKTFQEKPMLLLATSPGARGGSTVLDIAVKRMPYQGGVVKGSFSLPSFHDNFKDGKIVTPEWEEALKQIISNISL